MNSPFYCDRIERTISQILVLTCLFNFVAIFLPHFPQIRGKDNQETIVIIGKKTTRNYDNNKKFDKYFDLNKQQVHQNGPKMITL